MYVYEVVNTETGARGCITSMFPDLEQGVTVRHKAYHVRIESRAMSYKAALDNERLSFSPSLTNQNWLSYRPYTGRK